MRLLAPLALLMALAVIGALLLGRSPDRDAAPGLETAAAEGDSAGEATVGPVAGIAPSETTAPPDTTGPPSRTALGVVAPAVGSAPARFAVLEVAVVDDRGEALTGAVVRARIRGEAPDDLAEPPATPDRAALDVDTPTRADGTVVFDVPAGVELTLWTEAPADDYHRGVSTVVPPLAPGEERAVTVTLVKPRGTFHGLVLAAEDDLPLAGVRVVATGPRAFGSNPSRSSQDSDGPVSGSDGRFELDLERYRDGWGTLQAPERSPARFRIGAAGADPERPAELRIARSAALEGRLLGLDGEAVVHATWPSYATTILGEPDYLGDSRRAARTDGAGAFTLEGLPSRVGLEVHVTADRGEVFRPTGELVLEPGERRAIEWDLATAATVRAIAVDEAGVPQPGVALSLYPASGTSGSAYATSSMDPAATATTDDAGRADFDDVQPGSWLVAPPPPPRARHRTVDDTSIAPLAVAVEVAADSDLVEVTVAIHRGLWITGRVVDPDGEPAASIFVLGSSAGGGSMSDRSTDRGTFALGPLAPGAYSVRTSLISRGDLAPSDAVEAQAGERDVLLTLKPGAQLVVRAIDPANGQPIAARVSLHSSTPPYGYRTSHARIDRPVTFAGLTPDTYHAVAVADDGRVGAVRDVRAVAGAEPLPVDVPLGPGCRVRVRYVGPQEYAQVSILQDGVRYGADGLQSGTEALFSVPAGPVAVSIDRRPGELDGAGKPIVLEYTEHLVAEPGRVVEAVLIVEE